MTLPNRLVRVHSNGSILYSSRLTIRADCPMLVQNFPMDVHTCNLTFGSYGQGLQINAIQSWKWDMTWCHFESPIQRYTVDDVIFNWTGALSFQKEPVDCPTQNSRLIQFALLHHSWTEAQIEHQFGTYSVLIISFHLKRHLGYFIVQTYLPCMLIVILSQVSSRHHKY